MGKVVKSVTHALTGKSGSSSSSQKTTEASNGGSTNWLASNPQYNALVNQTINEANKTNYTPQTVEGLNSNMQSALGRLAQGVDTSGYKSASDYLSSLGKSLTQTGQEQSAQAQGVISGLAGMSQEDMQKAYQSEYNSDLVNSQISGLKSDINEQLGQQIETLNQNATASGNMGNSRAGVAQGVMTGQAMKALASGETQYRTAEESAAENRMMNYMNTRLTSAGQLAQIGQNNLASGLNGYNMGMNYLNQFNQATTQNAQNQLTAGEMMRQYNQQLADVNRANQMAAQSPALQRLMTVNQGLGPIANWSTSAATNKTTNTIQNAGGNGSSLLGTLGNFAGQWAGNNGYLSFMGGSGADQQNAGGMFGSMFGNAFSH